ncbi:MAG: hypothetical protein JST54_08025 [Deltaproteobacteria bacterium]|nr:hypothetical protein [Deltaproteobacteria bacterium]
MTFEPFHRRRISWLDPRMAPVFIAAAVMVATFAIFWPTTLINGDEISYAGQARMLAALHVVPRDGDPFPAPLGTGGETVRYPLGRPALLALPSVLGFRWMYLAPLILHMMGVLSFGRMLIRRDLPGHLALVFAFHPVFWPFARTLMSDLPAVVGFIAAMDAWENEQPGMSALGLGWAIAVRSASLFPALGFILAVSGALRKRSRDAMILGLGCTLGLLLEFASTELIHGSMTSRYSDAASALLSLSNAPENLLLYAAGLMLIPPLPLLWLAASRRIERWAAVAVPSISFFIFYAYHDSSTRLLETFLGGQRLIMPAHAALLMATSTTWGHLPFLKWTKLVFVSAVAAGWLGCFAVQHLELRYGVARDALVACEAKAVSYNTNASRVALATDAQTFHLIDERAPRAGDEVVIISRGSTDKPTSRPTVELHSSS